MSERGTHHRQVTGNRFHGNTIGDNMEFLQWSCRDVARWVESLGFPQYSACFTENHITGRKLIYVNCNYLPKLGITDFQDMQVTAKLAGTNKLQPIVRHCFTTPQTDSLIYPEAISAHVRELLGITYNPCSRSIANPRQDNMGLFLERKSRTGMWADSLTYQQFLEEMRRRAEVRRDSPQ